MSIRIMHLATCIAVSLLVTPAAHAAAEPEAKAPSEHQLRFAACAHESKGLKGEEHQAFMSECLHGSADGAETKKEHRASGEASPQQSKMKTCNDEAGRRSLHGDERRAFMSSCLKG